MTIYFDPDLQLSKKILWTESRSTYNYPVSSRLLTLFLYFTVAFSLASFILFPRLIKFFPWGAALALSLLISGLLCVLYRLLAFHRRVNKLLKQPGLQPGQKQSLTFTEDSILHSYSNGKFYTKHPYSAVTAVFERKEWIVIYLGKRFIYFPLTVFRTSEEIQYFWELLDPKHLDNAGRLDVSSEMQHYPNASFQFCFAWTQQELVNTFLILQDLKSGKHFRSAPLQGPSVYIGIFLIYAIYLTIRYAFPNMNRLFLYIPIVIACFIYIRIKMKHPRNTPEQLKAQVQKGYAPIGYLEPQCVLVDGSHIVLILTNLLCSYPLSQIQKIDNTSRATVLNMGVYGNILIPARVFESPEQKQDFLKTMESYLPSR